MTKMLDATCVAGIVTSEEIPVPAAEILSAGIGASEGILLLDEEEARYIANTTPDLESTLEQLTEALSQIGTALTQVASALTILDAKPLGTLPAVPGATANIAAVTAAGVQIAAAQTELTTLKEILR